MLIKELKRFEGHIMAHELIYDWNTIQAPTFSLVELCDETLRDGIQSPSVFDPCIEHKIELLDMMNKLGITIADIGLPGAGKRAFLDVLALATYVRDQRLKIQVNCAARTHRNDIEPIATIQQKVGIPITAYCFLGTSPVRQLVESWDLSSLKKTTEDAISFAIKEGLSVAFVTEDTIRSHQETLGELFLHAIDLGIERLVLCDTVGHATPHGVKALTQFTKNLILQSKRDVKIDWHGHNDRGLAVSNALFAAEFGCDRIHGTALGVGERIGNTSIDQLMVNLKLLNAYPHDLDLLADYVEKSAHYCKVSIPFNYPVFGKDAFRTATGVHAAAVIKAQKQGPSTLADIIYSGVPAHWFGKKQSIEVGPMSGASNVKHWLDEHGFNNSDALVQGILETAKSQSRVLADEELLALVHNAP